MDVGLSPMLFFPNVFGDVLNPQLLNVARLEAASIVARPFGLGNMNLTASSSEFERDCAFFN